MTHFSFPCHSPRTSETQHSVVECDGNKWKANMICNDNLSFVSNVSALCDRKLSNFTHFSKAFDDSFRSWQSINKRKTNSGENEKSWSLRGNASNSKALEQQPMVLEENHRQKLFFFYLPTSSNCNHHQHDKVSHTHVSKISSENDWVICRKWCLGETSETCWRLKFLMNLFPFGDDWI